MENCMKRAQIKINNCGQSVLSNIKLFGFEWYSLKNKTRK